MLDSLSGLSSSSDVIARVVLHGKLRRKFGPEYTIAASTSARAVAVLCILKPGFREALNEGEYRVVRGPAKGGTDLDERMLHLRLPPSGEMHIFPVAKGRKRGGVGKIILGAVLVVAAFAMPALGIASLPLLGTAGAIGSVGVFGSVAMFGASMILGGIGQMLSPQPQGSTSPAPKSIDPAQSFLLGGQLNVAQQGIPVPVPYGRVMSGSVVVSVGYEAAEFVPTGGAPDGGLTGYDALKQYKVPATGAGGGGKDGGGGTQAQHTPVESPNTLRSRAIVRIIDVLGEGPIGGLVNGAKSIFLNGTPLQAADGSFNFGGVGWEQRFGWPDQDPVQGFPASEETLSINQEVTIQDGPVIQTVQSATANAVRVTMRIPALFDTDTKNGDIKVSQVQFSIDIKASKMADAGGWIGGWIAVLPSALISGKCTSPYEKSYRIELPGLDQGANTWDIRVTRETADSTRATLANATVLQVITVVTDHQLMYPDTAYVALTIDAQLFGTTVPTRTYEIDGLWVAVPTNYDPVARTYAAGGPGTVAGTWDTISWKAAATSNPAWILYSMLTHPRFGCGILGTSTETTRADLYVISQYCDQLVPNGFGGAEPRYTVNAIIDTQVEAYVMLQTMVSAFRGMTHWGAGQVVVTADMPKNPVKLVNQTNTIDGDFQYEGTSLKTRHNVVRVTWRDPSHQYMPTPETVEMTDDIARRGVVAADLTAWGCTSRGLAHRLGKWLLFTENNQTETIQFDGSLYHADLRPGDVFQQQDPLYFGLRYGGRLRSESTQWTLHLDSVIEDIGATVFTLTVVMPDNTVAGSNDNVASWQISKSSDSSYSIITLTEPLPQQPMPNAEWILVDNTVQPREFMAVSVAQPQTGRYQVTGVQYNPGKFDWIEYGIAFPPQVFSHLPDLLLSALPPPSDVSAVDYLVGEGMTTVLRVTVSWTPPHDLRVNHFQVAVHGVDFLMVTEADGASKDIDNLVPGTYSFAVRSVSRDGARVSVWVSTTDVIVDGTADPPEAPLGLTAVGGTRRVMLNWLPVTRRDIKHYEVWRSPSVNGAPTTYSNIAYVGGTAFLDANSDVLLPDTRWWYMVRAICTTDVAGSWSNQVWAQTTLLITDDLADGIINTAKFAFGLLVPSLSDTVPTLPPMTGASGMVYNTANSQLYLWHDDVHRWVSIGEQVAEATALIPAANIYGQITSDQILSLVAAKVTGQIISTQITDGSISTPKLSAGAVTTAKIAAGSITTSELSVASASNVMWNSCLEQANDGWSLGATTPPGFESGGTTKNTGLDPTWRLAVFGSGYIHGAYYFTNGTQYISAAWDPNYGDAGNPLGVPFPPFTPIEAQAMMQLHRCVGSVRIEFYNTNNTYLGAIYGNRVVTPGPTSGLGLANYRLAWAHGTSPPDCVRARLVVFAYHDGGSDIDPQTAVGPYMFWTQSALGASVANATQAQAWQPGGITSITGSMIKSQTIFAQQIAANAITAEKLTAGSVVAGKIAANAVVAGTVVAGAIGATEIAAQQIRSIHLASDFMLTEYAQIGTAVIQKAHIGDLQVDTEKIANNAVSVLGWASSHQQQRTELQIKADGNAVQLQLNAQPGAIQTDLGQGSQLYAGSITVLRYEYDGAGWAYPTWVSSPIDFPPFGANGWVLYVVTMYPNASVTANWNSWVSMCSGSGSSYTAVGGTRILPSR